MYYLLLAVVWGWSLTGSPGGSARLTIYPGEVEGHIEVNLYGHFLEHIYSSVVDGLWAEQVRGRSFEEPLPGGNWQREDETVVQTTLQEDCQTFFGDPQWTDYEYTLEARKDEGWEGFLIIFRAEDENNFYWWNLGGWGNRWHGLECEVNGRRHLVGKRLPGRIETGRWYRLRLRVEGDHLQGWLNNQLLLDVREGTHLRGQVGLGTWRTQARYRNLRVTTLSGEVLYQGPPDLPRADAIAGLWEPFHEGEGTVQYALDRENPLNSKVSQRITLSAPAGWHGLQQGRFYLRQGETYRGSVWMRVRDFAGQVRVQLRGQEGTLLGEQKFVNFSPEWKEYAFTFTPPRTDVQARLILAAQGKGTVWFDQCSLMSDSARANGGFRPDLLEAIRALQPPVIRWPGGCFAEFYHWQTSIGPQHQRQTFPNIPWGGLDHGGLGTDEFLSLCRAVGAEPLIVINAGTHDDPAKLEAYVQEAVNWLEYCNGPPDTPLGRLRAQNGHPEPYGVKYWEIDNETWFLGAEEYARRVRIFSTALRAKDPTIKILACGSAGFNFQWNREMVDQAAEYFDYLSIHHYESPANFATGPRRYEQLFVRTYEHIRQSRNPNLKIAVTEWNCQCINLRTGLYAGGLLNAMERQSQVVTMANPALFLRNVDAPAWNNAFINFNHVAWFPAPNYLVEKMYRDHYAPHRLRLEAALPDTLSAVATKSADGNTVYLKVVNTAPEPVEVQITVDSAGGTFPRVEEGEVAWVGGLDLDAENSLEAPHRIREQRQRLTSLGPTFTYTFPRYSATVLTLRRAAPVGSR